MKARRVINILRMPHFRTSKEHKRPFSRCHFRGLEYFSTTAKDKIVGHTKWFGLEDGDFILSNVQNKPREKRKRNNSLSARTFTQLLKVL